MSNEEEKLINFLTESILYEKGQTCTLRIAEGITRTFKVEKPFKLHGFHKGQIVVTVPLTLETLKGLGFISKLKGGKNG